MSHDSLYTNYEEAQSRTDSNDLFVGRLLSAIHRSMLENANVRVKPTHPFDMRYYYDALVRTIASDYDYHVQDLGFADSPIYAVNVPALIEAEWTNAYFIKSGLATKFVQLVQGESKVGGAPFDLSFACRVAAAALDESALHFALEGIGKEPEPSANEWDNWVGGFFASDES